MGAAGSNVHRDPGVDQMFQNFETATCQRHGSMIIWHRGVAMLEDGHNNAELPEGAVAHCRTTLNNRTRAACYRAVNRERAWRSSEKLIGTSNAPAARGAFNRSENLVVTDQWKSASEEVPDCWLWRNAVASKSLRRCRCKGQVWPSNIVGHT